MSQKSKYNLRVLPIFIFIAVLMLSIKVNSVFDMFKNPESPKISITQSNAFAEEKMSKETAELSQVLDRSDASSNGNRNDSGPDANSFTKSEINILQDLAERREALDLKSKEIDKRTIQLKVAEEEIDKKIAQLKEYEAKLKKLMGEYSAKEKVQLQSLVKMYSNMKPKDAARIFDTLDVDILASILRDMKPANSSAILSQMKAEKAKVVTTELMGNNN